ncbi:transcriptional regulator GcvA [Amycolatopsis dongchuanensis]|uniref:LysR family transcriptional regulator, glycine cleavage system transcriptional activator n=2 Tax=Amycolatopsis TaxID=1813 RepID=A0A1I4D3M7_9PSEU|nr:LysR family transcriptional regulator, glycine cleavage system transcriptional activator [Amycolatopsis sacchari]
MSVTARRDPLPPLNPTRVFATTGRLLSISKAAAELSVTPAAVSRQVRALERYLGVALFHRVHGGLELTAAGSRYLADITPLFAALEKATEAVRGGVPGTTLKIRSPATFAVRWLIPRFAGFHRAHPEIDVQLTTSPAPIDLDREDIDAGIQLGDCDWPQLSSQRLIPNELVPVAAPRLAATLSEPARTAEATLLHSLARIDDWALWLEAAGLSTVTAHSGMKYETSLLAYQAAIEGHGVAIAQKALVEKELADGSLVAPFDFTLDRGRFTYYFVWRADRPQSPAVVAFRTWLVSVIAH